jgi:hypothetical protein
VVLPAWRLAADELELDADEGEVGQPAAKGMVRSEWVSALLDKRAQSALLWCRWFRALHLPSTTFLYFSIFFHREITCIFFTYFLYIIVINTTSVQMNNPYILFKK